MTMREMQRSAMMVEFAGNSVLKFIVCSLSVYSIHNSSRATTESIRVFYDAIKNGLQSPQKTAFRKTNREIRFRVENIFRRE